METNKIEKVLLDRELKNISDQLLKIGLEITKVFEKYGKIQGENGKELQLYITKHVCRVIEPYYAGHTTIPNADTNPNFVPECIKKLAMDWAVKDFFENFDSVVEVVGEID